MIDIGTEREKFDVPAHVSYFNTAYNSPLLAASRDRLVAAASSKCHPWERAAADFFGDAEYVRSLAANLFGGSAENYAIIPAASYGISTAARVLEPMLGKTDTILLMAEEFPSNVLPWQRVSFETGCSIRTVGTPSDGDWTRAVLEHLDAKVRVAALSAVHWTNGSRLNLEAIGEACRSLGTHLVLDVTQSLGAVPLELDKVRPDFMVAAGYKWLLSPYGFGLLYVTEDWHNSRPLEETWLARIDAEDFANLVSYQSIYKSGARRFDVGETCVTTVLPGAVAALEQLQAWKIDRIAESLGQVTGQIAIGLAELGFRLPRDSLRSPHMIGVDLPPGFSANLVATLRDDDIIVSQRGKSLRIAPHLHVTRGDVARLLEACAAAVAGA